MAKTRRRKPTIATQTPVAEAEFKDCGQEAILSYADQQELYYFRAKQFDESREEAQKYMRESLTATLRDILPASAFKTRKDQWGTVASRAEVLIAQLEVLIGTVIETRLGRPTPPNA